MVGATDTTTNTLGGVALVLPMGQTPAVVDVLPARKSSEATDDKILSALVGLTERLVKLESSQRVRDKDE
uniref:Uncharacterized protein n=1 Tax=Peronospora matthiolae TaxID=2874970 RepID=A0AAV1VBL1_9STRA